MDVNFKEEEIKEGLLAAFNEIASGALEVFMALCAYSSEKNKIAKVGIQIIAKKVGFSMSKVVGILSKLKEADFIEAPFEGHQGKAQIYKLKVLLKK